MIETKRVSWLLKGDVSSRDRGEVDNLGRRKWQDEYQNPVAENTGKKTKVFKVLLKMRFKRSHLVSLAVLILSNIVLFWADALYLRLLGGVTLFCFLPGWVLIDCLLSRDSTLRLLERVLLSAGVSYLLSSLSVLAIHALPGEITLCLFCLVLDVLVLLFLLLSFFIAPPLTQPETVEVGKGSLLSRGMLLVLLLGLVAGFFRFFNLGYSEFQGDEVGVVSTALEAILGHDDVLFLQRKGPVETLVTMAFVLFTQGFNEFALRFPFALASFLGVMTTYLIGRQMFGSGVGFIAGLLFAIEGITLAFSRMVQYQGIVVFMLTLCVYCFYRFHRVSERALAHRYQFLGAAFFAFGLLTHYDAGPVALLLSLLFLSKYGPRLRRDDALALLSSLAIAAAIFLSFYLPFVFHPHFKETGSYVTQNRLGIEQGPYNNLSTFASYSVFYNSTYYVTLMMVLLAAGVTGTLVKGLFHKPLAYLLSASFVVALFLSALFPSLTSVEQANYAFVLFLPAAIGLVLSRRLEVSERILLLWFFAYFAVYYFVVREPGLHFYTSSAAWAILGGIVLEKSYRYATSDSGPAVRRGVRLACLLLYVLLAGYAYVFFIQTDPEYAMTFPQHVSWLYSTPLKEVPRSGRFGVPRLVGWKATAWLYHTGVLRGSYDTNERARTPDWYMRPLRDDTRPPRYVFFNPNVKVEGKSWKDTPESIERFYAFRGEVTVGGRTGLLIYEDRNFFTGGLPVRYALEDYAPRYDVEMASLTARRLRLQASGDRDVQAVSAFLEAIATPGDALVPVGSELAEALSYYYRGDLPYYSLPRGQPLDESKTTAKLKAILAEHNVVHGLFWAPEESDSHGSIGGWLDQHLHRVTERWFGNVRLALYTSTPIEARREMHYLQDLRLGEGVELLAYEVDDLTFEPGGTVDLTLYWAARSEMEEDYTVFTHLIDAEDRLWAQQDNPPLAGERPTSEWLEGEVIADGYHLFLPDAIPVGRYRLEVGIYQWQTGERLSVFQGDHEIGNRVLLPLEIAVE